MSSADGAPLRVLHQDNHLLAVSKPPLLPTMGAAAGADSLVERARAYVRAAHNKPAGVYLGIVSRLDAPVTGVVLLARTSKAAERLTRAFAERRVAKRYLAIVRGAPADAEAELVHYLRHDDRNQRVHATHADAPGAKRAELHYRVLVAGEAASLLLVTLQTGRKHQIRVQLAKVGFPIVGDTKYGGPAAPALAGIALHAWRLGLAHPVRKTPLVVADEPPERGWRALLPRGAAEALRRAADEFDREWLPRDGANDNNRGASPR